MVWIRSDSTGSWRQWATWVSTPLSMYLQLLLRHRIPDKRRENSLVCEQPGRYPTCVLAYLTVHVPPKAYLTVNNTDLPPMHPNTWTACAPVRWVHGGPPIER
eukprot:7389218-Prymnesium_polylepis.1